MSSVTIDNPGRNTATVTYEMTLLQLQTSVPAGRDVSVAASDSFRFSLSKIAFPSRIADPVRL